MNKIGKMNKIDGELCEILETPFLTFDKRDKRFYVNFNNKEYFTYSGAMELKKWILDTKNFNTLSNALEIMCNVRVKSSSDENKNDYTEKFHEEIEGIILDLIDFDKEIYEMYSKEDTSKYSMEEMGRVLGNNRNLLINEALIKSYDGTIDAWIQPASDLEDDEKFMFMKSDMVYFFETLDVHKPNDNMFGGYFHNDRCCNSVNYLIYYWNGIYNNFDFKNGSFKDEMSFMAKMNKKVIRELDFDGVKENLIKNFLNQDFIKKNKHIFLDLMEKNVIYKNNKIICTTNVFAREMYKLFESEDKKGHNVYFEEIDLMIDERELEKVMDSEIIQKISEKYNCKIQKLLSPNEKSTYNTKIYVLDVTNVPDILIEKLMQALDMKNGQDWISVNDKSFNQEKLDIFLRDLKLSFEIQSLENKGGELLSAKKKI